MKNRSKRQRSRSKGNTDNSSAGASFRKARRSGRDDFNPDYSYVKKDLWRIATLAGFFLGILVILALILN